MIVWTSGYLFRSVTAYKLARQSRLTRRVWAHATPEYVVPKSTAIKSFRSEESSASSRFRSDKAAKDFSVSEITPAIEEDASQYSLTKREIESKMNQLHTAGYFITRTVMDEAIRLPSRYDSALHLAKLLVTATGVVGAHWL